MNPKEEGEEQKQRKPGKKRHSMHKTETSQNPCPQQIKAGLLVTFRFKGEDLQAICLLTPLKASSSVGRRDAFMHNTTLNPW